MRQTRLRSDTRFPLSWRRCRPGQEDEYKVSFVRATFQGGLDKVTTACNCNLWIPLVSLSLSRSLSLLLACLLARRLGSPQPCALSLSLFLSFFLLSFASLSLSLSLSLRGEEEGQRPGPPAQRFAHLQLLAGEDLPRGLCPRGLGSTWGTFWAANTKDCTRLK